MGSACRFWLCGVAAAIGMSGCAASAKSSGSPSAGSPGASVGPVIGQQGSGGAAAGVGTGSGGTRALGNGGGVGGVGGTGPGGVAVAGTGSPGSGGMGMLVPGTGGTPAGGTGGASGTGGTAASGAPAPNLGPGQTLPPVSDYGAPGPFMTTTMDGTGPDGMYTIYRPTTLGDNGFKHPIATWGNGITTTPQLYPGLLGGIASHGFVIVASDSSNVTADLMTKGLDWLIKQNDAGGMFEGKLDINRAASIGYSLGGGAAVTAGGHPNVIVTVSMHGLPGMAGSLHGPLLLFTSTMDTFVTADGFVTPNFVASKVQTFYAWLAGAGDGGHLTPVGDAGPERAPMIAWLRLFVYNDEGAKKYFYGNDCILCKDPWSVPMDSMKSPQRKNWP
jgi:hypothetical protein